MRYLFYSIILLLLSYSVSAQQYPYKQGFETTLSGQVPSGFVGDITVLSYHGMNDLKGLAALLYSGDTQDTTITPLVGPLTQGTILVFYYRWVRDNIYPSEPKMPVKGDKLEIQLTEDDSTFTTVHLIDSATHQPNLNFKRVQVQLGSYAGKNVRFKFRCVRGSDRYFMDIDSISVQNQGGFVSIEETAENKLRVYPNPCRDYFVIDKENCNDNIELSITDVSGKTVLNSSAGCMQSVNVSSLSNGLYFIQSNDGKIYGRQKLMIQR
jgi:hypothetical protein